MTKDQQKQFAQIMGEDEELTDAFNNLSEDIKHKLGFTNHIFEVGEKVTFDSGYKQEHGIVKSLSGEEHAFVVYNCGGNWDDYENYTAARTHIRYLKKGWI